MKTVRRILAALLSAALLLGVAAASSASASNVYFMAVNDNLVEMTPENMPMVVGGVLYVPYTMLSIRDTGINLGVSAQYSASRRTALVSDGSRAVTFDLQSNTAYDPQGNYVDARAVMRNAMVFLPLAWVCGYFGGITYTTNRTPYGTLVRVTNEAVILSDAAFIDAADSMLRNNLASYQQAISAQQPSPEPSAEPGPSDSTQPDSGPVVYLALLWGDAAQEVAQRLESLGRRGLFLLTPQQLAQEDDLVRRLVGSGHSIGLDLTGTTVSQCVQQAREGAQLLSDIARWPVYIVRAAGLDESQRDQLAQEGWSVWSATQRWEGGSTAYQLLSQLTSSQTNYVEAVCSSGNLSSLSSAFGSLTGTGYQLLQTTAPAL